MLAMSPDSSSPPQRQMKNARYYLGNLMPLLKHVGFQFYVENVACFIMLGFVDHVSVYILSLSNYSTVESFDLPSIK